MKDLDSLPPDARVFGGGKAKQDLNGNKHNLRQDVGKIEKEICLFSIFLYKAVQLGVEKSPLYGDNSESFREYGS